MSEFITNNLGISSDLQGRIFSSLLIILLLWLVRFLLLKFTKRRAKDVRILYSWRKAITYSTVILSILLVGRIWITAFQSLMTFLGLLSAGLAIALKDLIANIAGWIFIILKKPFNIGDRIQTGDHIGDVIDIGVFQFTLLEIGNWVEADQSTGRIIRIPNGSIFTKTQANFSQGFQFIWNEIPVLVTFESNWQKVKEILQTIADSHAEHLSKEASERVKRASEKYMIFYPHLTPIVYTSVEQSGVLLTVRYLCKPKNRRNSRHAIWEDILTQFAEHDDIDFAYPTTRFYTSKTGENQDSK